MIFSIKFCSDWTRPHGEWANWRPVHADFSIYHKKYFAHGTRLESCYDLELTLQITGKKSSTTLVLIVFLELFFRHFLKKPFKPSFFIEFSVPDTPRYPQDAP